jgi:succinate-semialdehyde dehydrogenase/glutarate-semialdehyde dehydrogenase
VLVVADLISYYAKEGPRLLAPEKRALRVFRYRTSEVRYDPRGVVAVIGPWNFPLQLPLRDAVAAWLAGNAVVIKPSEVTPLSLLAAKEIWDETKLPVDLFGVVTGYGPTGAALIDAGVDFVAFTGSVETGKRVAAACGERLIPCLMELGGKAPLLVCEDADLERAAQAIVLGGFANSGQVCISVERVYAHRSVYDRLVERVVALTLDLEQGDPAERHVDVGPMTFPRQLEIVEAHVADALAKGARLRSGGRRGSAGDQFYEPTVLVDCHPECTVMTEEIFGPIVPIMPVDSDREAVQLANDSPLGLNAYVFTEKSSRARALADQLQAGNVMVNDVLINAAMPEAPFGGIKQSGFGRAMGPEGLRAMCHVRHLSFERVKPPARHPLAHPYTEDKYRWILRGVQSLYDGGSGLAAKLARRVMGIG